MVTPIDTPIDITNFQATAVDDLATAWARTSPEERLAIYEVQAESELDETKLWNGTAALLFNMVLTKGMNATEAHFRTCAERLDNELHVQSITSLLTHEIVSGFSNVFPRDKLSVKEMYHCLVGSYSLWAESQLPSLQWSIEQASGHNIASATASANVIVQTRGFDIDYLLEMIPYEEFKKISELTAWECYNPFCTILDPPC